MEEQLISKKEVLQRYGISYGALYRWKRLGLIPEEWFLRRTTPSGQETFFHEGRICPRVELILSRPDAVSLEALACELAPQEAGRPVRWLTVSDGFRTVRFRFDELREVKLVEGEKQKEFLEDLKGVEL